MLDVFDENNRRVGEVPHTGDPATDFQAMEALLRAHGATEIPRTERMMRHAIAFSKVAQDLYHSRGLGQDPPRDPGALIPFAVNSAFAAELFLKTLGAIFNVPIWGHELDAILNEKLPAEARAVIDSSDQEIRPQHRFADAPDFYTCVRELSTAFADWRYAFEKNVGPFYIHRTMYVLHVLHDACDRAAKPDNGHE